MPQPVGTDIDPFVKISSVNYCTVLLGKKRPCFELPVRRNTLAFPLEALRKLPGPSSFNMKLRPRYKHFVRTCNSLQWSCLCLLLSRCHGHHELDAVKPQPPLGYLLVQVGNSR